MIKKIFRFDLAALLVLSVSGCVTVMDAIYGVHVPTTLRPETIASTAEDLDIPQKDCYQLDTAFSNYLLHSHLKISYKRISNHYRPLQALYFNPSGNLVAYFVDRYASAFPSLDWNKNNAMKGFPPRGNAPLDTVLSFRRQLSFLRLVAQDSMEPFRSFSSYVVFVYWNKFLLKESRRLIKAVRKNCASSKGAKVKIIYLNVDNLYKTSSQTHSGSTGGKSSYNKLATFRNYLN